MTPEWLHDTIFWLSLILLGYFIGKWEIEHRARVLFETQYKRLKKRAGKG